MSSASSLSEALDRAAEACQGWLPFDAFMALAMLHPVEGYYARADRASGPFGAQGDFVTAPEMGPWMGLAVAEAFVRLAGRSAEPLVLVELGPGTGALAAQVLTVLADRDCLPAAYWLVEPSQHLRQVQGARLQAALAGRPDAAQLLARLNWSGNPPTADSPVGALDFPVAQGLVVAHEVLDALPVKRLQWLGASAPVLEWGLVRDAYTAQWRWSARPAADELDRLVQSRAKAAESEGGGQDRAQGGWKVGHFCELVPGLDAWVDGLWRRLEAGELIFVDYGYEQHELDHPERHRGTIAAHLAHRRLDDPDAWIETPGSRDLTAHVNFTALADCFRRLGAAELTLKSQAAWLLDHGVLQAAADLLFPDQSARGQPPADRRQLAALSGLQTLLSDAAMGQRFSVLTVGKRLAEPAESVTLDR